MDKKIEQFFRYLESHNLNNIVRFHNFTRAQLAQMADTVDDCYERTVLVNYGQYVAANAFLMAYAFLEEYLYLKWKAAGPEGPELGKNRSIRRYEPLIPLLGIAATDPVWSFLLKATTIRHCLLHANGRLSFMKKPPEHVVRAIVSESSGGITIEHDDRIIIQSPYVVMVVGQIRKFMEVSSVGA